MSALLDLDAVRLARAEGLAPIEMVARKLACSAREATRHLADAFGMPYWETGDMTAREPAFDRLGLTRAQTLRTVLVRDLPSGGGGCIAVVHDPFDRDLWTQLLHWAAGPTKFVLATPDDIHAFLNQHEARSRAVDAFDEGNRDDRPERAAIEELSLARASSAASPAVRLVNSTLYDALRARASDVHLESTPTGLAVKYRVDGVLDPVTETTGRELAEQAVSRLKVLADLDIAERRIPQDGSFRVAHQGREVDLRLSIIPGVHGEDAVIRILDKQAMIEDRGALNLEALGFDADSLQALRSLLALPHGMLLVTGPTGSGKTTTLYAALSETHTGRDKIVTIEDPVEYQLAGVLQIRVNEKKGLTFAKGLRSILRHDPDKIMVGEIRDRETAEIAVQSALTGHLVLTTVHANGVFDVFSRFKHMGLDPYALVSALNGIWAQRLLRLNCPHCSRPHRPAAQVLAGFDSPESGADFDFRKGEGCGDCRGTGFRGRQAVAEVLKLDDELRELIVAQAPVRQVKEAAYRKGTRGLVHAALDLVRNGRTTLEEVRRVTMAS